MFMVGRQTRTVHFLISSRIYTDYVLAELHPYYAGPRWCQSAHTRARTPARCACTGGRRGGYPRTDARTRARRAYTDKLGKDRGGRPLGSPDAPLKGGLRIGKVSDEGSQDGDGQVCGPAAHHNHIPHIRSHSHSLGSHSHSLGNAPAGGWKKRASARNDMRERLTRAGPGRRARTS
jgi:hypothetical protein